jgi:hypothetical protein
MDNETEVKNTDLDNTLADLTEQAKAVAFDLGKLLATIETVRDDLAGRIPEEVKADTEGFNAKVGEMTTSYQQALGALVEADYADVLAVKAEIVEEDDKMVAVGGGVSVTSIYDIDSRARKVLIDCHQRRRDDLLVEAEASRTAAAMREVFEQHGIGADNLDKLVTDHACDCDACRDKAN